jgi:hypothetical protein
MPKFSYRVLAQNTATMDKLEIQSMNTNRQAFHTVHMNNDPSIHSSLSHEGTST